jgi:DNA-binding NarL/FixJ family response regulator
MVVEDDAVLRREIVSSIRADAELAVLGEAGTVARARELLAGPPAPLLLLDLQLSDGSALSLIPEARARGAAVLVLTVSDGERNIFQALAAGAGGYLLKREAMSGVCDALKALRDGGAPISPSIARRLVDEFRAHPEAATLTAREWEVVELFAGGATYSEVGRALGMSVNTVREHVRKLYEKLHVSTKTEAVQRAFGRGR